MCGSFSRFKPCSGRRKCIEQWAVKKVQTHFHDLCVQKWCFLPWRWDAFCQFSACNVSNKKFWAHFHILCVQKRSFLSLSSNAFWKYSACNLYKKYFWVHFHDFCVQKRSCLLWRWDAFWKFSACNVYKKKSGHNFTISASKNEPVCCEVQTHFGSSPLERFTRKNSGQILMIYTSKNEAVCYELERHFGRFPLARFTRKNSVHIFTIYASKNEAVCCEIETHFVISPLARFMKHALAAFLQFRVSINLCCSFGPIAKPLTLHFVKMLGIWTHFPNRSWIHCMWNASEIFLIRGIRRRPPIAWWSVCGQEIISRRGPVRS